MILVAIGGTGWPVKFYQGGFFCYDHEGRLGGQSNSTEVVSSVAIARDGRVASQSFRDASSGARSRSKGK